MLDMCCLVLAGPRERLSWRLSLFPRREYVGHLRGLLRIKNAVRTCVSRGRCWGTG